MSELSECIGKPENLPKVENVGEEFIKWAEQGWAFEQFITKGMISENTESCPYSLYKQYMIDKINQLSELKIEQYKQLLTNKL